jgi:mono/diheme cytochrome c family protein
MGRVLSVFLWGTACLQAGEAPDYNRQVRPLLARHCFACHGPDDGHRQANLRLDTREGATANRKRTAIVPGKPAESVLLARLRDHDNPMPPVEAGDRLSDADIRILEQWIAGGAPYAPHWAFVPPVRSAVPSEALHPIDAFLEKARRGQGLKAGPAADAHQLVRRLSIDIRGLPATPAETADYLANPSEAAYAKLIDRFFADPAYGERMARPWLDLARYADSAGYGSDPLRLNMWPYRDWVIDAYNRNLPYDRFGIEQLAGDLLPTADLQTRIATGFHRNTMTNTEGGTDDEEFRVVAVKDRTDTTFSVFMGLTVGCAKCHTHKYDPITQTEYYRLYALFNQTADSDKANDAPTLELPTENDKKKQQQYERQLRLTQAKLRAFVPTENVVEAYRMVRGQKPKALAVPIMQELPAEKHRQTKLLIKGDFLNPGPVVTPGLPQALAGKDKSAANRLELAQWLFQPDNPLTARVTVNRLWAQVLGRGLVETEEDFGLQGDLPTHPELLDWLATEYIRLKWDTQAFLRLIFTSDAYRLSSGVSAAALQADPRNVYLTRYPRQRLEAETIRDQALWLAGLLSGKRGGPSVYPPQPAGLWQAAFNGQRNYPTSEGEDRYRRGLYTIWRRTVPYPSLAAFDAPSRETCTIRRQPTNTPLQAFVTLNDPVFVEAARAFAAKIIAEGGTTDASRLAYAYSRATGRPITRETQEPLTQLLIQEQERYLKQPDAALQLAGQASANHAAWTIVTNVLLNLDAVLTKN